MRAKLRNLKWQNLTVPGALFHQLNDDGKIFLTFKRGLFGIDTRGGFGGGHRKLSVRRRSQNEFKILVHETNRKLRRVVALFGGSQLSDMGRSDNGSLGQCVEEKFARQVQSQP